QFDQDYESNDLKQSPYSAGAEASGNAAMDFALDMNGIVSEGELVLTIRYGTTQYRRETVERLGGLLQASLREVIAHCVAKEQPELTPSDVLLKGVTVDELEQLTELTRPIGELENVYALTPMQKGMLFHSLMDAESGAYFEQATFDLNGGFDVVSFGKSLDLLVQRHETLRTNFISGWKDEPVQAVFRERADELLYEDLRGMEEAEREACVAAFTSADKARGFDLGQGSLMRVSVLRTGEETYRFVWSFHHILMDGWCMSLLIQEVFGSYFAFREQRQPELAPVTPFGRFIEWLENQNREAAADYWNDYLSGYEQQVLLPQEKPQHKTEGYVLQNLDWTFSPELSVKVEQAARQHQVTVNTLIQTVWGLILQKYNNSDDVVFGSVVAGRPAEIPGVESMIGLFINTIPVRITSAVGESVADVMRRTQEQALNSGAHDTFPLYEIQARTGQKRDLINHIMVFENYPIDEQIGQLGGGGRDSFAIANIDTPEQTNYNFNFIVIPGERITIRFGYNAMAFDEAGIRQIAGHVARVLEQVAAAPQIRVDELEWVTEAERAQIVERFNATAADYPRDETVHGLFEAQAERTPEQVAVVFEDERLTYRELNERANRLAHTLRANGVQPDQPVGIMVERSLEMIVGIFGILKAGGAYMPIDPDYPQERIAYMLEDSGAKLLLTQSRLRERAAFAGKLLVLEDAAVYSEDASNPKAVAEPHHLAYVIYTSGSTGKPKGVMVEHRSVVHTLTQLEREYPMLADDTYLLKTTFTFDVSVPELFGWYFGKGRLAILPPGLEKDPAALTEAIENGQITHLNLVPSMFSAWVNTLKETGVAGIRTLKYVFVAGEALPVKAVEDYYSLSANAKLENIYGPTEATIYATKYSTGRETAELAGVPIGRPLCNVQAWIMDAASRLMPVGVAGELCIAGEGVARGYLNRPELTEEKFVPNPFAPGKRMYRTGDLVRWMPDGNIEYLGRIDHQVKIRGYRIELGEVETQVLRLPDVREAVVVARENELGQKQLCAYFTADRAWSAAELRSALAQELPGYMIPSYFVQLERMPLNANGKIDRKALPAPEGSVQTGTDYVAPRTAAEQTLASVWQAVLGVEAVGVLDNFFELGGDSIKAIQVSSRLLQLGHKLEMKDLFRYATVAELSPLLRAADKKAEQREVSGAVSLTPIQYWFFEQNQAEPHHFNQAVMLHRERGFDETPLRQAVTKVVEHHDALRTVFRRTETDFKAWNRGIGEGELYTLDVFDLRGTADCAAAIEAKANEIQSGIDLSAGPLVKLGLFRCDDGDHLLIVIHHLVVDGVSWRILIEDLAAGYEQAADGQPVRLPYKTDSFRTWAEQLSRYAAGPAMASESAYWRQIAEASYAPLPQDMAHDGVFTLRDSETVAVQLTKGETEQLLKQTHRAYGTEVNDLLLTALGMTIRQWTGMERVLVNLEGHGREAILPDVDISRTVGWFTSQFPVVLEMGQDESVAQRIKRVKEGLRQIPHKGIGYGIWKHLSGLQEDRARETEPQISFNYLGQFDQDLQSGDVAMSAYSIGSAVSERTVMKYALDFGGIVTGGALVLDIRYNGKAYRKETMERLAGLLKANLQEVIAHCAAKERTELTPSDVLFKGLTVEQLDAIAERTRSAGELENVYALTPMQNGMLFHSLMEPDSGAYFQQATFDLKGSFNLTVFEQSLERLAERHEIFRTNFYSGWHERPLQVVYRTKRIGFHYENLRGMEEAERQAYIAAFLERDKARGFDLSADPLMRVSVLQTGEAAYRFVWSFH
ncbi:non-ribosomal peptide synthetase, partial [Paenibacillus ehimensis]|uniref:non-ribosomal peptide synthetase n=1 Tax=Paenibacillus ehimensis TaxID=79264 RepID=UPI000FDB82F1